MLNSSRKICTEGIKYAGSKKRLLPHILAHTQALAGVQTILDGFSGTTRVSQAFAQQGYTVTANDTADWSEVFATCYLKANRPDSFYEKLLSHLNALSGKNGWFTQYYGGGESDPKKPFRLKNTQKLDAIRTEIDQLDLLWEDKCVLLTSLILALDKVDNTLGHFASYLSHWSARSSNDLQLRLPLRIHTHQAHTVLKQDIFKTISKGQWDLAYFDPPYGSNNIKMPSSRVRYAAYYHFWTTVIRNDQPDLFGAASRRTDSRDETASSVFEDFRKDSTARLWAFQAIQKLLQQTPARYIILSYSSGGCVPKEELLEALHQNGKLLQFLEIDYRKNIMSEMSWTGDWARPGKHFEYLFVLEKK